MFNANNTSNFGEFIYNLVNDFYCSYILKSSKPQNNQWTVISSIVLENNNRYKVICFSNGTKSLPNMNYKSRKFQIFDCHAEILVLKCFKFFLLNALCFHIDKNNSKKLLSQSEFNLFKLNEEFYDIFEFNNDNKKFKLKPSIKFHLYISSDPCGECANIKYNNNKGINLYEMTGSKTIEEILNFNNTSINTNNMKYKFRTKSLRSDYKINTISYSLSCTDKIMLKNILGYQGKYLNLILDKIFINSLIINSELNNTKDNINSYKECLNYNSRKNFLNYESYIPEIYLLNKNENEIKNKNDKNSLPFSSYWYFPNFIKKVDPVNGIKTGGNIKDVKNIDFLRVKISNYDLCSNIFNFMINNKDLFPKKIKKMKKYMINKDDFDCYDLIGFLVDNEYINIKTNIINENEDIKNFLGKKRKILNI